MIVRKNGHVLGILSSGLPLARYSVANGHKGPDANANHTDK